MGRLGEFQLRLEPQQLLGVGEDGTDSIGIGGFGEIEAELAFCEVFADLQIHGAVEVAAAERVA